jgi:hypothetical protein
MFDLDLCNDCVCVVGLVSPSHSFNKIKLFNKF